MLLEAAIHEHLMPSLVEYNILVDFLQKPLSSTTLLSDEVPAVYSIATAPFSPIACVSCADHTLYILHSQGSTDNSIMARVTGHHRSPLFITWHNYLPIVGSVDFSGVVMRSHIVNKTTETLHFGSLPLCLAFLSSPATPTLLLVANSGIFTWSSSSEATFVSDFPDTRNVRSAAISVLPNDDLFLATCHESILHVYSWSFAIPGSEWNHIYTGFCNLLTFFPCVFSSSGTRLVYFDNQDSIVSVDLTLCNNVKPSTTFHFSSPLNGHNSISGGSFIKMYPFANESIATAVLHLPPSISSPKGTSLLFVLDVVRNSVILKVEFVGEINCCQLFGNGVLIVGFANGQLIKLS
ncbi:hypothetical protein P9112_000301 [Eukaryota sp. TZLM1-RC]